MTQTTPIPRTRAWLLAIRPKTLPAALAPVLVGTALAIADGAFAPGPALAAALGALLLQIGSNIANDYFDHLKGVDTPDRTGPTRVAASGLISLQELRWGMVVVFGLAGLVGLYLVAVGGWPILAVGVAAILAAVLYTGGPLPYGYVGLGDLFVFLFFGLVAVTGAYYVQTGRVTLGSLLASLPVGLLITAILVVNNLRDISSDRRAGKRTLAVLLGRRGARLEYLLLLAGAYLSPLLLLFLDGRRPWVLLPGLTLPLAVRWARMVLDDKQYGPPLNQALAGTAQLSLLFSVLLAIGLIVG